MAAGTRQAGRLRRVAQQPHDHVRAVCLPRRANGCLRCCSCSPRPFMPSGAWTTARKSFQGTVPIQSRVSDVSLLFCAGGCAGTCWWWWRWPASTGVARSTIRISSSIQTAQPERLPVSASRANIIVSATAATLLSYQNCASCTTHLLACLSSIGSSSIHGSPLQN